MRILPLKLRRFCLFIWGSHYKLPSSMSLWPLGRSSIIETWIFGPSIIIMSWAGTFDRSMEGRPTCLMPQTNIVGRVISITLCLVRRNGREWKIIDSNSFVWLKGKRGEKGRGERNGFHGSHQFFIFLLSLQICKITFIPLESFDFLCKISFTSLLLYNLKW